MSALDISVVIPTRNPDAARLQEVLSGLQAQTLPVAQWEVCVVDNGSSPALPTAGWLLPENGRLISEATPGLLAARLAGLHHTTGRYVVFIDDDTVPATGFLEAAVKFMEAHPRMGTAGGKILPRYLATPPPWIETVTWILALRDNGAAELEWNARGITDFPHWTPIGAGLLVRREALVPGYLQHVATNSRMIERLSWRGQGAGGVEDKDLVLHCLRSGWSTGYTPAMVLTHIIPPSRLQLPYFEKILPGVGAMWVQTLHAHGFESHAPIHPATLGLRKFKAWLAFKAWRSPAQRLQWLASCGQLEGLAAVHRNPVRYAAPASTH